MLTLSRSTFAGALHSFARAGRSYAAEEVEAVILALYGDPSRAAEANAWLMEYQSSQTAWELSVTLMASVHMSVRFFAANTLHQKLKMSIEELPEPAQASLLDTVLGLMGRDENQGHQILTGLCVCLVLLGLHFTGTPDRFRTAILDNPRFLSLPLPAALEFCLLLPQEWDRSGMARQRQDTALHELSLAMPRAVDLLQGPLLSGTEPTLQAKCLQALAGWFKFGMTLTSLSQSPLCGCVFQLLQSPSLGRPACEVLEAAIMTDTHPPEPDSIFLVVVAGIAALAPLYRQAAASPGGRDYCLGLCSLARALMERRPELIASGEGECLALCDLVVEMTSSAQRGVSEQGMEFWEALQTVEMSRRHLTLRQPTFARVLEVLATRCARYPVGFEDWDSAEDDQDDFRAYRRRVEESLLDCCVCLRSQSLALMCQLVSKCGDCWQAWEAGLFGVAALAGELTTAEEASERRAVLACVEPLLTQCIFPAAYPGEPRNHPLAHAAALLVVERYSKCLQMNPALCQPALKYVMPFLFDVGLSGAAGRAFQRVCARAESHIQEASLLEGLIGSLTQGLGAMAAETVDLAVSSLGRLVNRLADVAAQAPLLRGLVAPMVVRLQELSKGTEAFKQARQVAEAAACFR